jgi:CheY-like chemotaxis protein
MTKTPHVLVVDDDPVMRKLIQDMLVVNGFAVTLAKNGLKALVALESIVPDVILCDLSMPELDGLSFVDAIKSHETTAAIPVVILTHSRTSEDIIRGINLGARFYVTKPFQVDELIDKLNRAIESRK